MPTGDERVNLILKRFLSQNRMSENFMEYLDTILTDGLSRIFPASGLFTYPVGFAFSGTGKMTLSPDPIEGIDNQGHVLILEGSELVDVSFEDDGSSVYWVGLKYMQIPSGVYTNPRTGVPEYDKLIDEVGELGFPDTVVSGGGSTIVFNVNTLLEPSVNHSGRTVRVYLVNPLSGEVGVAFEDLIVAYSSPNNTVTSANSFGQGALSLNPLFYKVALLGPSIEKSVLNPFGDEYIILGEVTSTGGTPTTDVGEQLNLGGGGGHTLQRAYDGFGGSGSGRDIVASDQAANITQVNNSIYDKDIYHAALRITKDTDKSAHGSVFDAEEMEIGIDTTTRYASTAGYSHRANILDVSGNDYLLAEEAIDIDSPGARIRFTRGAVDLTLPGINFDFMNVDIVEISGSALGNDGVYLFDAVVDSDEMDLEDLSGASATLVAETSLTVSVYRPIVRTGRQYDALQINSMSDIQNDGSDVGNAIDINIPANADDTVSAVEIHRYPSDYLQILNDLKLISPSPINTSYTHATIAAIEATAGHIEAAVDLIAGNDVIADQDITATNGDITASLGDVIAIAGKVEATSGDVIAGDDVHANNNIIADDNAGGTGDFKYGLAKTYKKYIGSEEFACGINGLGPVVLDWGHNGTGSPPYLESDATGSIAAAWAHIHVPLGASIKYVRAKIYQTAADNVTMEFTKTLKEFTDAVAPNSRTTIGSAITDSTVGTDYRTLILDRSGTPEVIAADYMYHVYIYTNNTSQQRLYYVEIEYDLDTIKQDV